MKKEIAAAIVGICFLGGIAQAEPPKENAKPATTSNAADVSAIAPLVAGLQDWNTQGDVKLLDTKGPNEGVVLHLDGDKASCSTTIKNVDPSAPKKYKISFAFRRLSPGDGWIGCVQVFFQKPNSVMVAPITFQKPYPPTSTEWTKVSETFQGPAEAVTGALQMACTSGSAEVADLKVEVLP